MTWRLEYYHQHENLITGNGSKGYTQQDSQPMCSSTTSLQEWYKERGISLDHSQR